MNNVGYNSSFAKRPNRRGVFFILSSLCGLTLMLSCGVGCTPMYTKPAEREPATQAERNFRDLWNASCEILKKYGYTIDRQDRRDGVITTYAVSGGHGLEALWRKDASNLYYFQENTAQNILRAVRVTVFRLPDQSDEFDFKVEVRAARSNRPQPQLTNAVNVNAMSVPRLPDLRFDELSDRPLRRGEEPKGARALIVPLGQDENLARRIERSIRARAGLPDRFFEDSVEDGSQDATAPLPDMSTSPSRRTVTLAGPLEDSTDESAASRESESSADASDQESRSRPHDELAAGTPQGQEKDQLVCSLRLAQGVSGTTTPVSMVFRLRNVGDETIRLPQPRHGLTLFSRYRKVGEERWGGGPMLDVIEFPKVVDIAPGESLDVAVTFGFGSAGEYEIFFRYSARAGKNTTWSGDLDSNVLKFNITGAE